MVGIEIQVGLQRVLGYWMRLQAISHRLKVKVVFRNGVQGLDQVVAMNAPHIE